MQERNGKPQPIAYVSKICTTAEKNYSITERDTLAVIYNLKRFSDILYGQITPLYNICLNTKILEKG